MRLSEAIRLGASWSKQCKQYVKTIDDRTCGLGAAYEGCGGSFTDNQKDTPDTLQIVIHVLRAKFPYIDTFVPNPKTNQTHSIITCIW